MTTTTDDQPDDVDDDFDSGEAHYPIRGELVVAEPPDTTASAIEAAAVAALTEPGIPGRDEFLSLAMQARMMSSSSLVPASLRNKPADVFLVLLTGRDVGIPVTSALRKVYVVDGQPSLAPQLKLALVRRHGLGEVVPAFGGTDTWQGAQPVGPGGMDRRCVRNDGHVDGCACDLLGPPIYVDWTDAVNAGLVKPECTPGDHKAGCKCKTNWRTYPRRMLWWRAAGYCVDDYFPEVGLGLYTPDELGAITDADGRPIDPATVELPEGFTTRGGPIVDTTPAEPDVIAELVVRGKALPDEQRAVLNAKWQENPRLAAHRITALPASEVTFVQSMLTGLEKLAERAGWDGDAARATVRAATAATEPSEASDEPDGPDTADDAGGPSDGHTDPDPGDEGAADAGDG